MDGASISNHWEWTTWHAVLVTILPMEPYNFWGECRETKTFCAGAGVSKYSEIQKLNLASRADDYDSQKGHTKNQRQSHRNSVSKMCVPVVQSSSVYKKTISRKYPVSYSD